MRGEVQGVDECLLATIADLTNTPLSLVRGTALAYAQKKTWTEVCSVSYGEIDSLYWKAVYFVCDCFDKTKKLAHALIQASSKSEKLTFQCSAKYLSPTETIVLPGEGKGVIVLVRPNVDAGHIAPWENGFAYDPNLPGIPEPLPLLRFKWQLREYRIQGISQIL